MSAIGMKTADRTSAIPTTGPETSDMALSVASRGASPSSMWCSTASTTTIASSTTRPMASTSANSDSVLIEKPRKGKKAKVPTSDTGTAMSGMSVARQFWRKRKTTRITRSDRLHEGDDDLLDPLRDRQRGVEADRRSPCRSGSARCSSRITCLDAVGDGEGVGARSLEHGDQRAPGGR